MRRPIAIELSDEERTLLQALAAEIPRKTTQETLANATHWSTRTPARGLGTTHSLVHRVWQATNLKAHRIKTFKLSNGSQFVEKLVDVVGLYLNPSLRKFNVHVRP